MLPDAIHDADAHDARPFREPGAPSARSAGVWAMRSSKQKARLRRREIDAAGRPMSSFVGFMAHLLTAHRYRCDHDGVLTQGTAGLTSRRDKRKNPLPF